MLDKISMTNFKCFSNLEIQFSNLNIFSGLNGMGKSTVIQALLLLKQSIEQSEPLKRVFLNGKYVALGTGQDVLFENATNESIELTYYEDDVIVPLKLRYEPHSDVLVLNDDISNLCPTFNADFEYLNAERLAPKTIYEKSSQYVNNNQLGIYGQYTAHYLSLHQDDTVDIIDNAPYKTLKDGIQYWLNEISPNVKLNVSEISNADFAQINYYYTGLQDSTKTREYRPTNVGFGISYILPIITALLKAKKGSILVIENPEAHLHPRGQRKIGELISQCASRGVQIFLETHSDHVMNGIRICVKKNVIDHDQVKVYFFSNTEASEDGSHSVEMPRILSNGRFDFWPDGFFDEWEKALDEIV